MCHLFLIKNYYVGKLYTSHCLSSYIHLSICSVFTAGLHAGYTMPRQPDMISEASWELLEVLETSLFMFIKPAWENSVIPIQNHALYVICKWLLIELHYVWELQCKKNFIKYSVATKNKILRMPDVSLYEHIRAKSREARQGRMYS